MNSRRQAYGKLGHVAQIDVNVMLSSLFVHQYTWRYAVVFIDSLLNLDKKFLSQLFALWK